MNKHDMMKALALCVGNDGIDDCHKCPYFGMPECDKRLNEDAIALLESEPWYDNKPTYEMAIVYTKHTNLLPWLDGQYDTPKNPSTLEYYSRNREVHLILLVRHEDVRIGANIKHRLICRIKCPISPLPIRGEFECVSTSEMTKLLTSMGWKYKEKIHYTMFK